MNFAPRGGIAYSLTSKTVLRAGFGIYHQRYSGILMSSLFTNNAVYQKALSLTSSQLALGPSFPNSLASSDLGESRNHRRVRGSQPAHPLHGAGQPSPLSSSSRATSR